MFQCSINSPPHPLLLAIVSVYQSGVSLEKGKNVDVHANIWSTNNFVRNAGYLAWGVVKVGRGGGRMWERQ